MSSDDPVWCDDIIQMGGLHWAKHADYLRACDAARAELAPVTAFGAFTDNTPTVVCVARNEEHRLPVFIAHYRKLGVARFHIIDNASTDRTAEIAGAEPDVTLWSASGSYARAGYGQLWVGALARAYGLGRWVLNLDADELLVYPSMESTPLSAVQAWATQAGVEHIFTPLIDVYTDTPLDRHAPVDIEHGLLFDGKVTNGRSPYTRQELIYGADLIGGPRSRILAEIGYAFPPWLSKHALARWDAKTAYANVHYPYPFDRNRLDRFAALLHLKLIGDFATRVQTGITENEHWDGSSEYKRYDQWLCAQATKTLVSEIHTTAYTGPTSLISAGIIDPAPWGAGEVSK
jgi:hypothetical protein